MQIRTRFIRLFISGLILGLLLLCPSSRSVFAIGNPDSVSIGDVYVFRDVLVEGDQLFYCRYNVSYNSTPSEYAKDTWQMALYNSSGSLVATKPLNYYQENIISIYLAPSQAIGWQASNVVKIMGMPSVFGNLTEGVNMRSRTLGPGDYYEGEFLGGIMLTQAEILQDDWGISLLDSRGLLNNTGSTYFLKGVPGLNDMAPSIFEVVSGSVDVSYTNYTQDYANALRANVGDKLPDVAQSIGSMFGIRNTEWVYFLLVMLFFLVAAGAVSGMGSPAWSLIVGYSILAMCGYIFGGNIFYLAVELGIALFIVFAVYFVFGRIMT